MYILNFASVWQLDAWPAVQALKLCSMADKSDSYKTKSRLSFALTSLIPDTLGLAALLSQVVFNAADHLYEAKSR